MQKNTAEADELRRLLQRLFRRFGALATESTPCGKPLSMVHAHALMILLAKGKQSQQELATELCIDKSNVARLCGKLVEAGHVTQHPSEHDGRSRLVTLTAKGDRLAQEVDTASGARFAALLMAVPKGQRGSVVQSLQHLVAALEELPIAPSKEVS